ncbi:MAG: LuxR C-terminal-related transcriptional regulator [Gemmatimonadota bacterium]
MDSSSSRRSGPVLLALVTTEGARQSVRRIALELGRRMEFLASRQDALRRARDGSLLVLEDGGGPGATLSLVQRLHRAHPDLLIAVMPEKPDSEVVHLFEAGASVAIVAGQAPAKAAESIRAAEAGMAILDPSLAGALVRRVQGLSQLCVDQNVDVSRCAGLTTREREVAGLLATRATNEEIAERLGIAVGTVKTHVHNILEKLEVDGRHLAGVYWRLFKGDGKSAPV